MLVKQQLPNGTGNQNSHSIHPLNLVFSWCNLMLTGMHHIVVVSILLLPSQILMLRYMSLYCSCRSNLQIPFLLPFFFPSIISHTTTSIFLLLHLLRGYYSITTLHSPSSAWVSALPSTVSW